MVTDRDEHLKLVAKHARPQEPADALPAPEEAQPLPGEDSPYKAASTPSRLPLARLCCIMGRDQFRNGGRAYRFFQYGHLQSDGDFGYTEKGQRFTFRFADAVPKLIVAEGAACCGSAITSSSTGSRGFGSPTGTSTATAWPMTSRSSPRFPSSTGCPSCTAGDFRSAGSGPVVLAAFFLASSSS